MKTIMKLILLMLFFSTSKSYCQVLELDLGEITPGKEKKLDYKLTTFSEILLVNALPEHEYYIDIKVMNVMIDPLSLDGINFAIGNKKSFISSDCMALKTLLLQTKDSVLSGEMTEILLKRNIVKMNGYLTTCWDSDIYSSTHQFIDQTRNLKSLESVFKISQGQKIQIVVFRKDKDGKQLEWTYIIEGDPIGKWLVTYGFGYSGQFNPANEYFAKAVPDTSVYQITKKNSGKSPSFTPSILFSFIPYRHYNSRFVGSITGGLGANTEEITVILGGSVFYRQNLALTIGAAMKNTYRLNGIYSDGQLISENLEFEQLHVQNPALHYFISLSFRFNENPFGKSEED